MKQRTYLSRVALALVLLTLLTSCFSPDKYQLVEEVLPNGLSTTIIQNKNSHSSNEIDLRLLIKAGSLQENDDELGYAHFVEHMAFNGTRDFPKNKLIQSLNQLGIRFGSHANASTSFDHTEYRIKLDTNEPERLVQAVSILKQWAAHIQFKADDVRSEIPIIVQEWKLREPTLERASFKLRQAIYKGSRFINRFPSGTLDSIQNVTPEKLRGFFKRWYHPANTHLIISGDIEVDAVKKLVSEQFADWEKIPDAASPVVSNLNLAAVPDHVSLSDSSMLGSEVSLAFASNKDWPQTLQQRQQNLHWQIGLEILKQRLAKRLLASQGKINQSYTQYSQPSPNIQHIGLTAILSKDDYQAGMDLLSSELAHIKNNGITQQELDNVRNSILKHESSQQDSSSHLATVAVENALYGWPIIDQPSWYKALKTSLPKLTPQQINTALNTAISSDPHIIVSYSDQLTPPDMSQLKQIVSKPKQVQPSLAAPSADDIWKISPATKGSITAESKHRTGADKWQLSNSISVFYKHSDSDPGKVYFELSAKGGLNLFEAPEVFQARLALPVMQVSGLRNMDAQTLNQWITSKGMLFYPKMGFSQRGFSGSAPKEDFQTLLQILYVALTEAQVSEAARAHVFQQNKTLIEQLQKHDAYQGQQRIEKELLMSEPALRSMTTQELEAVSKDQMQSVYKRYFANAQQYRLAIVGDISADAAKSAVLATLANLAKNHPDTKARKLPTPSKPVSFEYTGNGQRNAGVSLKWFLPRAAAEAVSFDDLQVLSRLAKESLNTKIREELGLVYSLNASARGSSYDSTVWELAVDFACDVEKREEVVKAVQQTLVEMANSQIPQTNIDALIKSMKDERRQRYNGADQQARWLAQNFLYNEADEPHTLELDKRFANITSQGLQKLLSQLVGNGNISVVIGSLP